MNGFFTIVIFFAGCLVGGLVHRIFSKNAGTNQKLSQNLNNVSSEFAEYQDKVDDHFKATSELVQQMTQSYAAVHQHLSDGAQHLSRASLTPLANAASEAQAQLLAQAEASDDEHLKQPRDYSEDSSQQKK